MYIRDNQADIRLSIDGVPIFDSWATWSGGDLTANDAKTRPGAMGKEKSVGGSATRGDLTLTTQWTDTVLADYTALESKVGVGEAKASANWLDKTRSPIPDGMIVRTGTVKSVSDPNYDTNGNAVGMLTVVLSLDEEAA